MKTDPKTVKSGMTPNKMQRRPSPIVKAKPMNKSMKKPTPRGK